MFRHFATQSSLKQSIRIWYECTVPFTCILLLSIFSSAYQLPTAENRLRRQTVCSSSFLANVWQNCPLPAILREFCISCSSDPFVFVKEKICQFLNRLKIGVMITKSTYVGRVWTVSLNSGVRGCQLIFTTRFALLTEESKWSRLGSLFSPFVLSEDGKLTGGIFHFSQNSFPSDSTPTFGGGEEEKLKVHVSTFIP